MRERRERGGGNEREEVWASKIIGLHWNVLVWREKDWHSKKRRGRADVDWRMACTYLCLKLRASSETDKRSQKSGTKNWPSLAKHRPLITQLLVSILGHEVSHTPCAHQLTH